MTTSGWELAGRQHAGGARQGPAVSPASMASVRSQGASDPAAPGTARGRRTAPWPRPVGGGQGVEQALSRPMSSPRCSARQGGGRAVEPDRAALQVVGQPLGPGPARPHRGVHHLAGRGRPPWPAPGGRCRRRPPGPATVVGSGSSRYSASRLASAAVELAGLPHHHHPPLDQERRGGAGVDHRPHVEVVDAGPAELLDHQRRGRPPPTNRSVRAWAAWATSDGSSPLTR